MDTRYTIEFVDAARAGQLLDELLVLLRDAVESGASIGFLPPLSEEAARIYWGEVIQSMRGNALILLVARQQGRVAGAVQLALAAKPNATHRAEVQKLMVLRVARKQGIGRALMRAVEYVAKELGRTTLVLDTRQGDPSEHLYESMGYVRSGAIPSYARSADGSLHTTVLFYKLL